MGLVTESKLRVRKVTPGAQKVTRPERRTDTRTTPNEDSDRRTGQMSDIFTRQRIAGENDPPPPSNSGNDTPPPPEKNEKGTPLDTEKALTLTPPRPESAPEAPMGGVVFPENSGEGGPMSIEFQGEGGAKHPQISVKGGSEFPGKEGEGGVVLPPDLVKGGEVFGLFSYDMAPRSAKIRDFYLKLIYEARLRFGGKLENIGGYGQNAILELRGGVIPTEEWAAIDQMVATRIRQAMPEAWAAGDWGDVQALRWKRRAWEPYFSPPLMDIAREKKQLSERYAKGLEAWPTLLSGDPEKCKAARALFEAIRTRWLELHQELVMWEPLLAEEEPTIPELPA